MTKTLNFPKHLTGLSEAEVQKARDHYGTNRQQQPKRSNWGRMMLDILSEPMLVLLIAISVIYILLQQYGEAWFMMAAILIVSGISLYQDNRSRKALESLETLNAPLSNVIRDSTPQKIPTEDIVPGDLVIAEEGSPINADGQIVFSHDFSVNESTLTGEAHAQYKAATAEDNMVYSGTMVSSGLAVYEVVQTGTATRIGQLGASIVSIKEEPTPLQQQIGNFVRRMAILGVVVFLLVWGYNYMHSRDLLASLLKGLTLAMSILPEEIPVAFTTFMALGSRKLMRSGIIVKKTRTVETLGSATVICADKTGTITENRMELQAMYVLSSNTMYNPQDSPDEFVMELIETAMWASEPIPFDPMEKTLHAIYQKHAALDNRVHYTLVHEYPLGGVPPMMTHVFQHTNGDRIIATKGAPEAILPLCNLSAVEDEMIRKRMDTLAENGYRLLGVARSSWSHVDFPATQQEFPFVFLGIVAFHDPPKPGIQHVFQQFYDAGIEVKIITGDNLKTTRAIASIAGIRDPDKVIEGQELMALPDEALIDAVQKNTLFTRMFPEAKLAAINALKEHQQIVAMVGDGVNDGPALKAAHIGIAMGQRGTETAKSAAALILMQDDFSRMVEAIATGRRIYTNLKKAIRYIISIHIPIILTVALPLFFGWIYPDIFTPVHVIFLELVMGPTCSIVYENEPMEKNTMLLPPRRMTETFLEWRELSISILQGLMITAGILYMYHHAVSTGASEELTRTLVFSTLILANIFLTLVNRSFYFSFLTTLRLKNNLLIGIIFITLALLAVILYVPPVSQFFHLIRPSVSDLLRCAGMASIVVFWFEGLKWIRRRKSPVHLHP